MMSTSGDILSSNPKRETMIHVGYIHNYTGGCSLHGRYFMSTSGSLTMSTLMDIIICIRGWTSEAHWGGGGVLRTVRGYNEYIWRYHEYIKVFSTQRDIVSTLQDFHYIGGIS